MKLHKLIQEIGDSSAPGYTTTREEKEMFDTISVTYEFFTDSKLYYYLTIEKEYDGRFGTYFISFDTHDDDQKTDGVVNRGEQYRIMKTVVSSIKKEMEHDRRNGKELSSIVYYPVGISRGDDRRDKLYRAYIQKEFPSAEISSSGGDTTVDLPRVRSKGAKPRQLAEIGDSSAKAYPYDLRRGYDVVKAEFTTDSGLDYEVLITKEEDHLEYSVEFDTEEYDRSKEGGVTNKGEQYRIMATIVKIIKQEMAYDLADYHEVEVISFYPVGLMVDDTRRLHLYKAYIQKEFPDAVIGKTDHLSIRVILPGRNKENHLKGLNIIK